MNHIMKSETSQMKKMIVLQTTCELVSILDENNLIYINGMQPIENIFGEVIDKIEEFRKKNERKF